MRDLDETDTGRLMDAGAGLGQHLAGPFIAKADPALDDVVHLEVERMTMPTGAATMSGLGANDMRQNTTSGCLLDPQIAIDKEGAQPAIDKPGVFQVRSREFHRIRGHRQIPSG